MIKEFFNRVFKYRGTHTAPGMENASTVFIQGYDGTGRKVFAGAISSQNAQSDARLAMELLSYKHKPEVLELVLKGILHPKEAQK